MRTIDTRTAVYTLDELSPEARTAAIGNVTETLVGDGWDTHDIERITETITYAYAEAIGFPGRENFGEGDFPGITGVKVEGWDLERAQTLTFTGTLTRDNAPALPWASGMDYYELDSRGNLGEPGLITTNYGSDPVEPESAFEVFIEAVQAAQRTAWNAGRAELDYMSSAEYATEHAEANELLFHPDGRIYYGPRENTDDTASVDTATGDPLTVTVTFTTPVANAGLAAKVVAGIETLLNEGGLDHYPTTGAGPFHDLNVVITRSDTVLPIWGSDFDGEANNEDDEGESE